MRFNNSSWRKSKFAIPAIIVYFLATMIGDKVFPNFNIITSIVLLIITILYAFTVCEKQYVKAIITACVYKIVFILLSTIIFTVLSRIFDGFAELLYGTGSNVRYIYVVIHKVALFAVSEFLTHIFNKDSRWEIKSGIYTLMISFTTIIGLGMTMIASTSVGSNELEYRFIIIAATFVLINIILYLLIFQIQKLQANKYELMLLQEKMKFEEDRYADISAIWNNIRKVKHDVKQHLIVIKNQLNNNEIEDCMKYVNELLPDIEYIGKVIKSDNSILDYLINSKLGSLENTQVYVSGIIVDLSDIRDIDLSCIIGNILDNAIEAISNLEDKRIELIFSMQNSSRIIICKNTIGKSVLKYNKELKSTKPHRDHHGLGHTIIESVVKKYNGFVDYFEDDDMFGVEVILPLAM